MARTAQRPATVTLLLYCTMIGLSGCASGPAVASVTTDDATNASAELGVAQACQLASELLSSHLTATGLSSRGQATDAQLAQAEEALVEGWRKAAAEGNSEVAPYFDRLVEAAGDGRLNVKTDPEMSAALGSMTSLCEDAGSPIVLRVEVGG
ncbi:hypothetical protein QBL02_05635 [Leucobacter sp. UT-8R-CII-1-4]|uniref:hypothetical protein n=1 Tax=Leucobacter sp. UT-8R-CII-1-4 TaxID=3040075 RepID=UPI0024A9F113|nr:hypothetical protein [Leucobacter sp. UT-8R-CII-1-4]MDI6023023.1 hypothetical protein [Leucobacter sp. UT-8R-CII-1-4]